MSIETQPSKTCNADADVATSCLMCQSSTASVMPIDGNGRSSVDVRACFSCVNVAAAALASLELYSALDSLTLRKQSKKASAFIHCTSTAQCVVQLIDAICKRKRSCLC